VIKKIDRNKKSLKWKRMNEKKEKRKNNNFVKP